jgi:hypothetical protein
MKLQRVMFVFGTLAASAAWGSAGLTSAGVDPGNNPGQPEEPTLAQVAPTNTVNGAVAPGGTVVAAPGTTDAANPPSIAGNVPGGANATANGAPAAAPRVATPPPPPDPATLPVSVIRPVNRASSSTPAPPLAQPTPDTVVARNPARAQEPRQAATPSHLTTAGPAPTPRTQPASTPAPSRSEPIARASEPTPIEPADASSSSVIFYSGSGIAGAILLLSIGAFLRGRNEDTPGPRT